MFFINCVLVFVGECFIRVVGVFVSLGLLRFVGVEFVFGFEGNGILEVVVVESFVESCYGLVVIVIG